ncbi:MAG TPA: hypothetical protein VGM88_01435 [Kofleriaceae bacterium]|jgi:hypothetical protein
MKLAALCLLAAACGGNDHFVVVTVDARPAVHDAAQLSISLSNAGSMLTQTLALAGQPFPVTFSVDTGGRAGDLTLTVDALDSDGTTVGAGQTTAPLTGDTASVLLDGADFVVNSDFPGDQFPSDDFESNGNALAVETGGLWTAAFRTGCDTPCNIYARRFDATGAAVTTTAGAGTGAIPMSTTGIDESSTPAIAGAGANNILVWDAFDSTGTALGVACRSLDAQGATNAFEETIEATDFDDVVAVAGLASGNFVASWQDTSKGEMHTAIVTPDCSVQGGIAVVATGSPRGSSVTTDANRTLYVWEIDGTPHYRLASATGSFVTPALTLAVPSGDESVAYLRAAPAGAGFWIVTRWENTNDDGATAGHLDLYKIDEAGNILTGPITISMRSGSDSFSSDDSFGVAAQADGSMLTVWSTCGTFADGDGCAVLGHFVAADGTVADGDDVVLPTTTKGDQTKPSVAALPGGAYVAIWSDASAAAPDIAGLAARARIIYPPGDSSSAR